MYHNIRLFLKKIIKKSGYEIHRTDPSGNRFKWLQDFNINTIIDIGANVGQFILDIRKFFPTATIYSFEPLKDVYEELIRNSLTDSNWINWITYDVALGDFNGSTKIKRNTIATDSSLLSMAKFYKERYFFKTEEWEENIRIRRLDDLNLKLLPELMIKMDVEGFEDKVIKGGETTFKKAKVIFTEVTFQKERYEGQILFDNLYGVLKELGFKCYGFYSVRYDPKSGAPSYADAVFVKD